MIDKNLLAPCGLYCGACGVIVAYRDDNRKLKEILAQTYGSTPGEVICHGCMSEVRFKYCRTCDIRSCVLEKNYEGCYQCDDFPCRRIHDFSDPVGRQVMLRAVPEWRRLGTEKWVEAEEKRYSCPACGARVLRGSSRCRACKEPLNLD